MAVSRRVKIGLVCGALAGVGAVAALGPVVRHEAADVASRYGATVVIESVRPTWLGVRLQGVRVTLEDAPSTHVVLDDVSVSYGASGRKVRLVGGRVESVGPAETVLGELEALRGRLGAGGTSGATSSGSRGLEVEGVVVDWRDRAEEPTQSLQADNLRFEREAGRVTLRADTARAMIGSSSLAVSSPELMVQKSEDRYRVAKLVASSIDAEVELAAVRVGQPGDGAKLPPPDAKVVDVASRAAQVRAVLVSAARAADGLLEPDAEVALDGVHAKVLRGDDALHLGPGEFRVRREGPSDSPDMVFELRPGLAGQAGAEAKALTFSVRVPIQDPEGAIEARVDGGPIHFSTLGIQEGNFGLLDVEHTSLEAKASLVLAPDGRQLTVDGEGKVLDLSIDRASLSSEPVRGMALAWKGNAELALDGSLVRVKDGELDIGDVRLLFSGRYERAQAKDGTDGYLVDGHFEVPLTTCQTLLDSAPKGLLPKVAGSTIAGSFAIRGQAQFDTTHLDDAFDVQWDATNTCRVVDVPPDIHVSRFRRPFKRTAYTPDGKPVVVETGPGTRDWVSFQEISRFMEVAVISCEDGRFHRHDGFDREAIQNSIRDNLKAGKFVRGASTISMQLAKNLYLTRAKNLSRKLQEAVLTLYLEQELTKEQILELYLNVVEFGPNVYGVGPAARTYFNSSASGLSLAQSLYLASVLPAPQKHHFEAGGAVSDSWMKYLRTIMRYANKRHRITDEELEIGTSETLVRGSPAPDRARGDVRRDEGDVEMGGDPFALGPGDLDSGGGEWLAP